MARIMYSSNGEQWWRTEWQPQCEHKLILATQCQGTAGHDGEHWCYKPDGSYAWDDPDEGCGWTPPGHKSYKHPEDMAELHHLRFRECVEVTDPEILKRLDNDDPPEAGASINKPLAEDDPMYDECMERLEDYKRTHPDCFSSDDDGSEST